MFKIKRKRAATAAISLFIMLLGVSASAQYSQSDMQTGANKAMEWLENNSQPRNSPASAASDYYIMSLSRMGKEYDYDAYARYIENVTPATRSDGQRLIMTTAACGRTLSDSFIKWYTYEGESFESAADNADSIITLTSCGYDESSGADMNNMVSKLLSSQQQDGSFEHNILSTAKSIIALSKFSGLEYELYGEHDGEVYTYNVNNAIEQAVNAMSAYQSQDGGAESMLNTAYLAAALDSVGVDADNDPRFIKNDVSPIGFIISRQGSDGSVSGSADDTAFAAFALVSHLRAMQGKAGFFDFFSGDSVNTIISGENAGTNHAGESPASADPDSRQSDTQPHIVQVTQIPTKNPEHSSVDAEEYGPFPLTGPFERQEKAPVSVTASDKEPESGNISYILWITAAALAAAAITTAYMIKKRRGTIKSSNTESNRSEETDTAEVDLLSEADKVHEVIPTEELYDPELIKKLIPVDKLDDSIDALISSDTNKNETNPEE